MEMERILSASGPTGGHLVRLSDHKEPKKIAWFQCVGSRDLNRCDNSYCSSVCCMYAIKEAVIAKEHAPYDLDCAIFFMDMRTPGKEFRTLLQNARTKGVRFMRSRVHTIDPVPDSGDLSVRYVTEDGRNDHRNLRSDRALHRSSDRSGSGGLANRLGIELTDGNFCKTDTFMPGGNFREGIYVCGAFQGPKDIPQSVVDASAAASAAGEILAEARNTLTKSRKSSLKPTLSANGHASAYSSAAAASTLPVWSMYRMSGIMPAACPMSSIFRTTSTPAPKTPRRP
jgi:heterodisulfide reductase subunit A